jgi:quercetin dioxygenase-like cupin family protein
MAEYIGKGTDALDPDAIAELAQAAGSGEPPRDRRDAMYQRVLARIRAHSPAGTVTVRAREGNWIRIAPKIEIKVLNESRARNEQTTLWRLEPGAVLASHAHSTDEECLVLEGEIHFENYYVRAGDYHLARGGHRHPTIESTEGALMMIRGEFREHVALGTL